MRARTPRGLTVAVVVATVLAGCTGATRTDRASESVETGDTTVAGEPITPDPTTVGETTVPTVGGTVDVAPGATVPGTAPGAPPPAAPGTTPTTAAPPGFQPTTLFTPKEATIGISKDQITLCAHAALTYGNAFGTTADDFNVYWNALNDKGGVHGRRVITTYENDDYKPETAVQAASACKAKNPFILLGGIGFDQIPAVRNWAEENRILYMHHTATVNGSQGKKFSYTTLPSTERMGEVFGELVVKRYRNKTIGIIKRGSPNWEPGVDAFKRVLAANGVKIAVERQVVNAQGNYTQELLDMKRADVDLVWAWENALASTQIITQSKSQDFNPTWLLFPFNLTSQSLDGEALDPPLVGVAMYAAYSNTDYSGPFAPYADDMKLFEAQYRQYRPNTDLNGVGGDLLFLNWSAQKAAHVILERCGPNCDRNKLIDTLRLYKGRPTSSACDIEFRNGGNLGAFQVNVMETYRSPRGKVNWRTTDACVEHIR